MMKEKLIYASSDKLVHKHARGHAVNVVTHASPDFATLKLSFLLTIYQIFLKQLPRTTFLENVLRNIGIMLVDSSADLRKNARYRLKEVHITRSWSSRLQLCYRGISETTSIYLSHTAIFPRDQSFGVEPYIFLVENNKIPGGEFFIEQIACMCRDRRRIYFFPLHLLSKLYGVIVATETMDFQSDKVVTKNRTFTGFMKQATRDFSWVLNSTPTSFLV